MKRLLFIVVVSTLLIFGLRAQNSTLPLAPVNEYKNIKSERFDKIMKDGKPVELFDKVSQKRLTLTGDEITPNGSTVKTNFSFIIQKSAKEDVATITLNVIGDPWGDGTGIQMLIDANAEIVDNFWDWWFDDDEQFYIHSDYKIPENADYNFDNPNVIVDGTGSVDIPGGVYDFIFFRPFIFFLALLNWEGTDDFAMADNFTFLPGFEYIFTVESAGEVGFATPEDITLSNIVLPQPSLYLTDQEIVSVVLYNNGMENIVGDVELAYKVNGGAEIIEIYTIPELAPGAEIIYTFNAKADFSTVGFYTVEARVDYEFDTNPYNNTLVGLTKKFALIDGEYFYDNFDTPSSMLNWSTIDGNGDGLSWQYDDWFLTDADGGKGCLQVLCQTYGADEYLITDPIVLGTAQNGYQIAFYASRLGNDNLKILYGTTYNVEEMELLEVVTLDLDQWGPIHLFLDKAIFTPGNYFFAFHYEGVYSNGSRGINFDNFFIGSVGSVPEIALNEHQLKLYPNPVSGVLNVELKDVPIDKVIVYNSLGKIIHTTSGVNDSIFKLNTKSFTPGFYFISVQTEAGIVNKRFVVE